MLKLTDAGHALPSLDNWNPCEYPHRPITYICFKKVQS